VQSVTISAAVEGLVDEAVAERLIQQVGGRSGPVYGKSGKPDLRKKITGYNNAAQRAPWLVLVDLDAEADCVPSLRRKWLDQTAPQLCFRVAVRSVEAWLLADRERMARFLHIPQSKVPLEPERLDNPKRSVVDLARQSRRGAIRKDMVPRERSGRAVGPAYTSRMIEFVLRSWDPQVAAHRAESLRRALACLDRAVTR